MNINPFPTQHLDILLEFDRTMGLKEAIARAVQPGSVVLDAGCGTGILGMMALKAGAERVVAVDSQDLSFARALARENKLQDGIQFLQADLDQINPASLPQFDVVLALIYSGHPIADEGQVATKQTLYDKFLRPDGQIIPNRIKWYAYACEWAAHDFSQQRLRFERAVDLVGQQFGLRFQEAWATRLAEMEAWQWATAPYETTKSSNYFYLMPDVWPNLRMLSGKTAVSDITYSQPTTAILPPSLTLDIQEAGRLTLIVWNRELWFDDILVSSRDTPSIVRHPAVVTPDDRYLALLDQEWKTTNVITVQKQTL